MRSAAVVLLLAALVSCGKNEPPLQPELYVPKTKEAAKEAITLRLRLQPGDVLVYEFHSKDTTTQVTPVGSDEEGGTVTVEFAARMVDRVISAEEGTYAIERTFENPRYVVTATGSFKGKEKEIEEMRRKNLKLKDSFLLDERYRRVGDSATFREQGLPEQPIREGDTWTTKMPNIGNPRDPASQFNDLWPNLIHTAGKIEQLGPWKTISIEVRPEDPTVLDVEQPATIWYDLETGVMVQARFTVNAKAQRTVGESELKLIEFRRGDRVVRGE
ncbi:MAG: hypothetical protein KatS3mg015_2338 [Fimbriimonadales bacterium]|nr:MAG: hypothetical protein KatS3mg015_2338 [Fimbriimonadales bacterium]